MMNNSEEVFKNIPGYHGYMASNYGNIANVRQKLSQSHTGNGYLKVKIAGKTRTVHRLVALAFHGIPNKEMVCNHINRIKTDNRPENLEWCTQSDNVRHSDKLIKRPGRRTVLDINTGVYYESLKEVCDLYNTGISAMSMRLKGENGNKTSLRYV